MADTITYAEDNFEQIYLVGVKFQPGAHQADLYTLVLYHEVARGDRNRPLAQDGRIVFFSLPEQAREAICLGDLAFRKYMPLRTELSYTYDVPRVLQIIERESWDEGGLIADFINELLDFTAAIGCEMPSAYKLALDRLADDATFDKDLSSLSAKEARAEARDAMHWCLGAILTHSKLYEKKARM